MGQETRLETGKRLLTRALRIRRGYKQFLAVGTGISTGIYSYHALCALSDDRVMALEGAVLIGAVTAALGLLVLDLIRLAIRKSTAFLRRIWQKRKDNMHEQ